MKPSRKIHLWSASYCLLLAVLNWSRTVEYSRAGGTKGSSILTPIEVAFVLSAVVLLVLGVRIVRSARRHLETGRRVTAGRWIQDRSVVLYTLPLLFYRQTTSSWIEPDGAVANSISRYGGALTLAVLLFAILGMLLFQVLLRLVPAEKAINKLPLPTPAGVTPVAGASVAPPSGAAGR